MHDHYLVRAEMGNWDLEADKETSIPAAEEHNKNQGSRRISSDDSSLIVLFIF